MENTTPLLNADRKASLGCFASLPGSGPSGEICSRCSLLEPVGSKFVCGKWQKMMGRKAKPISPASPACRYFSPRPAFNSAK